MRLSVCLGGDIHHWSHGLRVFSLFLVCVWVPSLARAAALRKQRDATIAATASVQTQLERTRVAAALLADDFARGKPVPGLLAAAYALLPEDLRPAGYEAMAPASGDGSTSASTKSTTATPFR